MKKIVLAAALATSTLAHAQTLEESVLYSNIQLTGSARYVALGGAFTALGNDFSAISLNPAAIGIFRKDEFQATANFGINRVNSSYYGTDQSDFRGTFDIGAAGIVLTIEPKNKWNLGLSVNQLASFDRNTTFAGVNPSSSIIDQWISNSNGYSVQQLLSTGRVHEYVAWQAYLTDIADSSNYSYTSFATGLNLNQEMRVETAGGVTDFNISFGGQLTDKLVVGAAIGIPSINYTEERRYSESGFDQGSTIDAFTLRESYATSGAGFNLKLGAIYRPTQWLRLGMGFTTPTWYRFVATYSTEVNSTRRNAGNANSEVVENPNYTFFYTSPMRFNAGAAVVIGKQGLLSFDYQVQNLQHNSLRSRDFSLSDQNDLINHVLNTTHTLAVGGEWRYHEYFARGGYRYQTPTYVNSVNSQNNQTYSAGLGYRGNTYSVDVTWSRMFTQNDFYAYSSNFTQPAQINGRHTIISIGVGYRF